MTLTLETARAWYGSDDVVHDFSHIERVYHLAERISRAEGADLGIVRAAVLLHDARGSEAGSEGRDEHHLQSALFAGEVLANAGWTAERVEAVQHCIRAHRFRAGWEMPASLEAMVLFDADKLDALGAIGVARAYAYGALMGQPLYGQPSAGFLAEGHHEPDEPHTPVHEYFFKLRHIKDKLFTRTAIAIASEREAYLRGFFERLAAEVRGDL